MEIRVVFWRRSLRRFYDEKNIEAITFYCDRLRSIVTAAMHNRYLLTFAR